MIKQVKDTKNGDSNKTALPPKSGQQLSPGIGAPKTWSVVVTGLSLSAVAIGGVYTIVRVASVFTEVGAIATFITGSIVGLFTLLAIVAQAAIYWQQRNFMMRQWKAMQDSVDRTDTIIAKMQGQLDVMTDALEIERAKTEPRLQITNVRAVNLRVEESPIFLLSIKNVGELDAEETLINLRVSFGRSVDSEGTMAQKLPAPQTVTIPAGQEHTYAIPWDGPITREHAERLDNVRVSGFIKPNGKNEREFCYRYYAIRGDRAQGMPEFVPCDFDTRLTKVVTAGSARLKLEAFPPTVITTDAQKQSEDEDDEENPN